MTKERLEELRARWGVRIDDEHLFAQFKMRFSMVLASAVKLDDAVRKLVYRFLDVVRGDRLFSIGKLSNTLHSANDLNEFAFLLQQVFWALEEVELSEHAAGLYRTTQYALSLSPGIDFEIAERDGHHTIFRAGAKELDVALVQQPLEWLHENAEVATLFEEALSIILSGEDERYKHAVDNLRKALEELLKAVLGNKKSIESQKPFLLPWLKEKGLHQEMVNMAWDMLSRYATLQNDAVKHGSRSWTRDELEFMVYQTGVFLRMIVRLETTSA
jgi:hypothetical protein